MARDSSLLSDCRAISPFSPTTTSAINHARGIAVAERVESQSSGYIGRMSQSTHFTYQESMPTHTDVLSMMSNCQSPRISPDLQVADMSIDRFSCDAQGKNSRIDEFLPGSRSSTPTQISDYGGLPILSKPLSESAAEFPLDVIDPVAYAKRSIEQRRQKSIEEGKVSRPLNSYMLYRKAYQQVARRVIRKNQQQSASQTVGTSWTKLERDDIKSKFRELAKIDHRMHLEAFPSYKYTPNQGKNSKASLDSRRAMTTERKFLRRSGQGPTDARAMTAQGPMRKNSTGFSDQHHNKASECWFEERHGVATHITHHENTYEPCSMPSTIYAGSQFATQVSEQLAKPSSNHMSQGDSASHSFEAYVDPSLFSSFDNAIHDDSARYFQWGPRDFTGSHDLPLFISDISSDHLIGADGGDQGVWRLSSQF